jgi:hypothetical protein
MTELLSQAYSLGNNEYQCPNWMSIMIRNAEDPFNYEKEEERERLISLTWQMYIPVHLLQHRIWEK